MENIDDRIRKQEEFEQMKEELFSRLIDIVVVPKLLEDFKKRRKECQDRLKEIKQIREKNKLQELKNKV